MDCSTPGLPVHHQLPEFTQTHVHWVSDAIQPSHPLSSPSPPTFNLSQHQGLFQWVGSSQKMAKVLELQLQHLSFQSIFRVDFLWDWLLWSTCCPRDSQESYSAIDCSVQSLSHIWHLGIPWTAARQASLSITNSQSLFKLMSLESVMPSNHLIFCCPLLLPPLIFPSIRVFSSESILHIRWPKYWSFSFNISPSNEHPGLISFRMDWLDLLQVQGTLESLLHHHTVQKYQFFSAQLSSQSNSHIHTWLLEKP